MLWILWRRTLKGEAFQSGRKQHSLYATALRDLYEKAQGIITLESIHDSKVGFNSTLATVPYYASTLHFSLLHSLFVLDFCLVVF